MTRETFTARLTGVDNPLKELVNKAYTSLQLPENTSDKDFLVKALTALQEANTLVTNCLQDSENQKKMYTELYTEHKLLQTVCSELRKEQEKHVYNVDAGIQDVNKLKTEVDNLNALVNGLQTERIQLQNENTDLRNQLSTIEAETVNLNPYQSEIIQKSFEVNKKILHDLKKQSDSMGYKTLLLDADKIENYAANLVILHAIQAIHTLNRPKIDLTKIK